MKNLDYKKDFGLGVKAISFILSFLMIVTVIPNITVFAEGKDAISSNSVIDIDTKKETEKEPEFVTELSEKRTLNEKYFLMDDGSITVAQYSQPVHFVDSEGLMKDIDNSLVEVTDTANDKKLYKNKSNSFNVSFSKEIDNGDLAFLEKDEYKIAWSLEQNNITTAKKIESEKTVNKKVDELENITSSIEYDDVFDSTDITYVTNANGVKENIVLKDENAPKQFSFNYNTYGLKYRTTEEGNIELYNEEDPETVIFYIEKPYMFDAQKYRSDDVKMEITETVDGLEATIIPDEEWINSPERVYPIVIDPTTLSSQIRNQIWDIDMMQGQSHDFSCNAEDLVVGVDSQSRIFRSVIRFLNLPDLGDCNTIVNAKMNVTAYQGPTRSGSPALRPRPSGNPIVYINRVTQDWPQTTNWNTTANAYDPIVTDYFIYNDTDTSFQADITKVVRGWYDGTYPNYGVMLKSANESTSNKAMQFTSSDWGQNTDYYMAYRPTIIINYRNTAGIEDYWNYSVQEFGRYGTGYINNYNGNLVYIHDDAFFNSDINGFTISHIYNTCNASIDNRAGNGWRLNMVQRLEPVAIPNNSSVKYVYTDGDGTKHFFVETDGKIIDEDGLGYTYSDISEGELLRKITTKDNTVLKFDYLNYLRVITDSNGNTINLNYAPIPGIDNYLGTISTSSGGFFALAYDSNYRLISITDNASRTTQYTYTGNNLTGITYPDGTAIELVYDSANRLNGIIAPDNSKLQYQNDNHGRVSLTKYLGTNGSTVSSMSNYSYSYNQTKIKDAYNRTTTYQFDTLGRATCIYDDNDNIYSQNYTNDFISTPSFKNNKVALSSNTVSYINNYIINGVFCNGLTNWLQFGSGSTFSIVTNCSLLTQNSVKITSPDSSIACIMQPCAILSGKTYTFSGYIRTENVVSSTHGAGIEVVTSKNRYLYSSFLCGTTDTDIDNGFKRVSLTFTLDSDETVNRITAGLYNASGTAYIDSLQLEEGSTANPINLIDNSGFERNSGSCDVPSQYSANFTVGNQSGTSQAAFKDGAWAIKITPSHSERYYFKYDHNSGGLAGDVYSFGGWSKADSVPKHSDELLYKIVARIMYADGTWEWFDLEFNPYISDWQFGMKNMIAAKNYTLVELYICYYLNCNTAYFDDLFLYRDTAQSYTYDDNGNVVSTQDYAAQKSTYDFKNDSLSRILNPSGTGYEYMYDANKNLTSSRSNNGLQSFITYDSAGNPTATSTGANNYSATVQNGKTYYIRLKGSGKYLSVENSGTTHFTPVIQSEYTGGANQRWKLEKTSDGYFVLIPQHTTTLALDIPNASNTDETALKASNINYSYTQKFKIMPQKDFTYKLTPECSSDGKLVSVGFSNTNNIVSIITEQPGNNADQEWYFEEVSTLGVPEIEDGGVYQFRARHSGLYLDVYGATGEIDTLIKQCVENFENNQRFKVEKYNNTDYYTITPLHAPNRLLCVSTNLTSYGYKTIRLADNTVTDSKLFSFSYDSAKNAFRISPKAYPNECIDVAYASIQDCADVITAENGANNNKYFVFEKVSDTITSSATYQNNGNYLASTTDSRGKTTSYTYDTARGLQTAVTDPNGNTTIYAYNAYNDRLNSVSSGNSTVGYTYNTVGTLTGITSPSGTQYSFSYDQFGRTTSINIGGRTLSAKTYRDNNSSLISSSAYGNGQTVEYSYDFLDRLTQKGYNGTGRYSYTYDNQGNLVERTDLLTDETVNASYDLSGRISGLESSAGNRIAYVYDTFNRVSAVSSAIGSIVNKTGYVYGNASVSGQQSGLIYGVTYNGTQKLSYLYDELSRLKTRTLPSFITEYTYLDGASANTTTTLIKTVKNGDDTLTYSYDDVGNITQIKKNGVVYESYEYDGLNQLTKVTRGTDVYTYSYDGGGNITEVKLNGNTVKSYTYGDTSWKDLLTSFNNQTITYDNIGNPTTYRDGFSFEWSNGRQLIEVTHGTDSISYRYDDSGLRTKKTVNGTTTDYYWLNGILQGQKTGNEYIIFLYDESGSAYGFLLKNGTTEAYYYYIFNAQGDVIGIVDESGTQVVSYDYSAWGEVLSVTGTLASTIGQINPIRYRGYYYDSETHFYYLQSRYYDPETGRFINADGQIMTGDDILGCNLFAYCGNNPINNMDIDGHSWKSIKQWISDTYNKVKNQLTKAIGKVKKNSKKSAKKIASGVTLELGIGMGLKGKLEIAGIDASVGVKSDSITAKINSKKSQIGQSNEAEIRVGVGPVEIGPSLEDWNPVSDNDEYVSEFSWYKRELTLDFGAEIYLLYGFSANLSMDLNTIAEGLVIIFE